MEQDPIPSASSSSHEALVSGPSWRVFLSAADFADFVHMLGQLRMAVASLRFQGLWNAGGRDRPPSQAKVGSSCVLVQLAVCKHEPCVGMCG